MPWTVRTSDEIRPNPGHESTAPYLAKRTRSGHDRAFPARAMAQEATLSPAPSRSRLAGEMGLLSLTATGVCSMVGAGINVVPFMLQRHVPGIGPHVVPAYVFAALPAVLAGLAYAILASAMPRAGGSYVYASRALDPYLGFVASFSQWFSLCVATGVVAYVLVPFLRDVAAAAGAASLAAALHTASVRLLLARARLVPAPCWAARRRPGGGRAGARPLSRPRRRPGAAAGARRGRAPPRAAFPPPAVMNVLL